MTDGGTIPPEPPAPVTLAELEALVASAEAAALAELPDDVDHAPLEGRLLDPAVSLDQLLALESRLSAASEELGRRREEAAAELATVVARPR